MFTTVHLIFRTFFFFFTKLAIFTPDNKPFYKHLKHAFSDKRTGSRVIHETCERSREDVETKFDFHILTMKIKKKSKYRPIYT